MLPFHEYPMLSFHVVATFSASYYCLLGSYSRNYPNWSLTTQSNCELTIGSWSSVADNSITTTLVPNSCSLVLVSPHSMFSEW
jgi:hypothetical protein